MAQMRAHRTEVVHTKYGHSVRFVEGEVCNVPDIQQVINECASRGHIIVTEAELAAEARLRETEARLKAAEAKLSAAEAVDKELQDEVPEKKAAPQPRRGKAAVTGE